MIFAFKTIYTGKLKSETKRAGHFEALYKMYSKKIDIFYFVVAFKLTIMFLLTPRRFMMVL